MNVVVKTAVTDFVVVVMIIVWNDRLVGVDSCGLGRGGRSWGVFICSSSGSCGAG